MKDSTLASNTDNRPVAAEPWTFAVLDSPQCLALRLLPAAAEGSAANGTPPLADRVGQLLQENGLEQLVVEMDDLPTLDSSLLGDLVQLHRRLHAAGGWMRLSGLDARHQRTLRAANLEDRFPRFTRRSPASGEQRPKKPR